MFFSEHLTTHDVVSSVAHLAFGFPPENPDASCKFLLVDEGDFFSRSLSPTHDEASVQCTNADLKKRVTKSFTHVCSTLAGRCAMEGTRYVLRSFGSEVVHSKQLKLRVRSQSLVQVSLDIPALLDPDAVKEAVAAEEFYHKEIL